MEGDAGQIGLPTNSIDKISCHHSFEHFQGRADSNFILEIQRILKPGGRACLIPLFIGNRYIETTDAFTFDLQFDSRSHYVVDPSAMLPGGKFCGHYARIYDLKAFHERVVSQIDQDKCRASIVEMRMNGESLPDLRLACHHVTNKINYPYRALLIEKLSI